MNPSFPLKLLFQQRVDHAMSRRLSLPSKLLGYDINAEMSFLRSAVAHSAVMGMEVRIVVNEEVGW